MTERTVTVQTEQEETITLCDHCGLSDDAGEIKEYVPRDAEGMQYGNLDLHKSCLDEFGVEVPEGPTFADEFSAKSELDSPPVVTFTKDDIMMNGFIGLVFGVPGMLAVLDGELIGWLAIVVVAVMMLATVLEGYTTTQETVESMKQ